MRDALGPCLDSDTIAFEVQDLCHDLVWRLLRSQVNARCDEALCGGVAVFDAIEPLLLLAGGRRRCRRRQGGKKARSLRR